MTQSPLLLVCGLAMCLVPIVVFLFVFMLCWSVFGQQNIMQRYEWYWQSVTGARRAVVLGGLVVGVLLVAATAWRSVSLWGARPGKYGDWSAYVTGNWGYVALSGVVAVVAAIALIPAVLVAGRARFKWRMKHKRSGVADVVALEQSEIAMQRQRVVDTASKAGLVVDHRSNEIRPKPGSAGAMAAREVRDPTGAARRAFGVVVPGLLTASKTVSRMWSAAGCLVVPTRPGDGRVLMVAEAGSGKTVLLMGAIACYQAMGLPVVFIDGKGDSKDAEELRQRMGATVHTGGFDFFAGADDDLLERLMKLVPTTASTTFYVDEARGVLKRIIASMDGRRPADVEQLHTMWQLAVAKEAAAVEAGTCDDPYLAVKSQGAIRHQRVWESLQARLDQVATVHSAGGWTLAELFESGGVHVIPVVPESDAEMFFANILLFELRRYLGRKKKNGEARPGVMVVDEFAQIVMESFSDTTASEMAAKLFETARSLNMGLWIAGQSMAGLAEGPEMQQRLSSAGAAFIVGRGKNPEQEAGVFGTAFHGESTGDADGTGAKSTRAQHTYRVNPEWIRNLPNGVFYFTQGGMVRQFIALPSKGRR